MRETNPFTARIIPVASCTRKRCAQSRGLARHPRGTCENRRVDLPPFKPAGIPGHLSAARMERQWFVLCASAELKEGSVLGRVLQDVPIVLFRAGGRVSALLDRCPHRNVPLSFGCVRGEQIECRYHGWRFDGGGTCRAIPGLAAGEIDAKARRAPAFAARERDGFVWVYSTPDVEPDHEPFRFPHLEAPGYATVRRSVDVRGTLHASVENALDVPHTAFLHGGLFRTAEKKNEIDVVVRRYADRVEAEYVGEPRPPGIAGKLLAPGGGVVVHVDRFLLPCVAQVEYRLGERSHFVVSTAMTPVSALETRFHALVTFRLPIPAVLVKLFLTPIAMRIFRQDAEVLALQTASIERFGGEQFANTEIDVLGQQILRLIRQAERGEKPAEAGVLHEARLRMRT